jgi:hypothetical protein
MVQVAAVVLVLLELLEQQLPEAMVAMEQHLQFLVAA